MCNYVPCSKTAAIIREVATIIYENTSDLLNGASRLSADDLMAYSQAVDANHIVAFIDGAVFEVRSCAAVQRRAPL